MYIHTENEDWKDFDENILSGDGIWGNFVSLLVFFKTYLLLFLKWVFGNPWIWPAKG